MTLSRPAHQRVTPTVGRIVPSPVDTETIMQNYFPRAAVRRIKNEIHFFQLGHPRVVSDFLDSVKDGQASGYHELVLVFRPSIRGAFPNACVPVAGLIEYYTKAGCDFSYPDAPNFIRNIHIFDPLSVVGNTSTLNRAPLSRVWQFNNPEEISLLVNGFVGEIYQQAVCEEGVIEGLTWCLNEVMDNVLQHSGISSGYVMGQIHKSTKHIAFCIFDAGQGIYNSLRPSKYSPRNPIDAITLAVREGVTRDSRIGQGNGMWGLHNIVKVNSGMLSITSNTASYMLKGDEIRTFKQLPVISRELGTTIVDFQIDFDKGISIASALGGHIPVNLRLESLEDEKGNIVYKLEEKSSGTGTRQSGERIRNELTNIYKETKRGIEIDFDGVSVISSSFADELIGKLVAEYGFFGFTQIFRLKNMNEIVQSIVNRSVSQRMASTFAPDKFPE